MEKKLTTVIALFFLTLALHLSANDQPKAFIITGEQSGENLARWFVQTTKLNTSHKVFIVTSKTLTQELEINHLKVITLHLALLGIPHAVIFKSSWINAAILDYVIKPKAFGLPNLLSSTAVCDEFTQGEASAATLATHLDEVFLSFKNNADSYKLRQHKINNFRKAFLKS